MNFAISVSHFSGKSLLSIQCFQDPVSVFPSVLKPFQREACPAGLFTSIFTTIERNCYIHASGVRQISPLALAPEPGPFTGHFQVLTMHINNIKFKALFQHIASFQNVWKFSTVNSKDVDFIDFRQKSDWLQSTGLHDCEGREIFEGDLMKWNDSIVEVIYEHGCYKVLHDGNSELLLWYCVPDCEIIGSRFE